MTFLLAGGGTGGHLAPGIAVAEELMQLEPDARCVFVGSGRAIEQRLLGCTPFECVSLSAKPLSTLRRHPLDFLRGNLAALRAAVDLVRVNRPRAVIGLGGYASVPVVLAAALLGVPVWLLEQNAIPGRANRWLAHWFPICVSFEASVNWLPLKARVFVTGNPVRRALREAFTTGLGMSLKSRQTGPRTLLVMGGSQGSSSVNRDVIAVLRAMRTEFAQWRVIHQAGDAQCEVVRHSYEELGLHADVQSFFGNVPDLYSAASFIICRSGATTLTEIALAGLPAILIPFPHAADQHQVANARAFSDPGAAITVIELDPASTQRQLLAAVSELVHDDDRRVAMSRAMQALARPDAAREVALMVSGT